MTKLDDIFETRVNKRSLVSLGEFYNPKAQTKVYPRPNNFSPGPFERALFTETKSMNLERRYETVQNQRQKSEPSQRSL